MTTGYTMMIWRSRLRSLAAVAASILSLSACSQARVPDADNKLTMKPSITYLHLLRHTPFFTSLSTEQLEWVIDHSREWEVSKGSVLSKREASGVSDTDYWVLLDGGWHITGGGHTLSVRHDDPGKWFSTRVSNGQPCALVATEHGYVMRIAEADMLAMLQRGFAFEGHLQTGRAYYASLFGKSH